jgi:hypothetical protein
MCCTAVGKIRANVLPDVLKTDHPQLIRAGVACMHDIETFRAYVTHENSPSGGCGWSCCSPVV